VNRITMSAFLLEAAGFAQVGQERALVGALLGGGSAARSRSPGSEFLREEFDLAGELGHSTWRDSTFLRCSSAAVVDDDELQVVALLHAARLGRYHHGQVRESSMYSGAFSIRLVTFDSAPSRRR